MSGRRLSHITILFLIIHMSTVEAFIQRQGKHIVDAQGHRFFLRGIGLGGWLVPEGYMLKIPGYGSPSHIRQRIVDLIGEEETEKFFHLYRQNYVTRTDVERMAAWGCNSIRLPMHHGLLMDAEGHLLPQGMGYIDSLLTWCEANRLYLILDLHCASGGQNADNISDAEVGVAGLWLEPHHQRRTIDLWRALAQRYAHSPWIAGYDLLNEPVMPAHMDNRPLRDLYMRITSAIREVDANHLIFIEGNWYATDFTHLSPPWDEQMVYSFHKYWNPTTVSSLQPYLNLREIYDIPLWLGESGENSNIWFNECVRLCESLNIGWCWWTHKKLETLTSPYSAVMPASYARVLAYWRGEAPRPSQQEAMIAFSDLAEALKTENCRYHPDVVDALFRQDHHSRAVAFRPHLLPGSIHCAEYDLGGKGVAYFDGDSDHPNQAGGNAGKALRNDGVDISRTEDGDYAITHIEDGEWLNYHVKVVHGGRMAIRALVRGGGKKASLRLLIDHRPITEWIKIPATKSPSWRWLELGTIDCEAGPQEIRLLFGGGGFEIRTLTLKPSH